MKQVEPPPKLSVAKRNVTCEFTMDGQRVALVLATPNSTPSQKAHVRQMPHPVCLGDIVEDRTQEFVAAHALVEPVDEAFDVGARGDLLSGRVMGPPHTWLSLHSGPELVTRATHCGSAMRSASE